MPNQSSWPLERKQKYAEMIRLSRPWESGGPKTKKGRQAVKYNKLQTGAQSAPVIAVYKLLYKTKLLLREIETLI